MKSIPVIGMGWAAGDNAGAFCDSKSIWDNIIIKKGPSGILTETIAPHLPNTSMRLVDRQSLLLAASVKLAYGCLDGLEIPDADGTGIYHGSCTAAVNNIIKYEGTGIEKGFNTVNPMEFPNTVANVTASRAGIWYKLKERVIALSEGVTSGLDAIGLACEHLGSGIGAAFLAGASEELPFWIQDNCELNMFEGSVVFLLCNPDLAISNKYGIMGSVEEFASASIEPGDNTGKRTAEYVLALADKWGLDMEDSACLISGCWNSQALNDVLNSAMGKKSGAWSSYLHQCGTGQPWEGYTLNSMLDFAEALSGGQSNKKNYIIVSSDRIGLISCLLLKI